MTLRTIIMPSNHPRDQSALRTMRVTLPAEPWGENPPNTEPERLAQPIRTAFDWRKDSVLRRAALVKQ